LHDGSVADPNLHIAVTSLSTTSAAKGLPTQYQPLKQVTGDGRLM